jgi:hypothetical protein
MNSTGSELRLNHKVDVRYGDRRQVQRRLQELSIQAWCSESGTLQVEVQTFIDLLQVQSVVRQFNASRVERVNWLEQCWLAEV